MSDFINYKKKYLNSLSEVNSFKKSWKLWKETIENILNINNHNESEYKNNLTGEKLFNLGDFLRQIFFSNPTSRDQSGVSASGTSWECFVTWYLNLIFWNTPVLVMRQNKKFLPEVLYDSTAVTIANNPTNSESDILMFNVPQSNNFSGKTADDLNKYIKNKLNEIDLNIIQCKTNWADNSQIPMLWDMVYNSKVNLNNVSVGKNGFAPNSFRNFSYSFVTVPTQKDIQKKYKSTSVNVLRVKNLTGGNFWGNTTVPDVARNIKELPNNFYSNFEGGITSHLENIIQKEQNYPANFLNLLW